MKLLAKINSHITLRPRKIHSYFWPIGLAIFAFCMVAVTGCKEAGNRKKGNREPEPLHFALQGYGNVEPLALVNFRGAYHLFYNAFNNSGLKSITITRHAISKDLINWSESATSIFPKYNNAILRGGIIVDSNNLTGYGTSEHPPLVAVLIRTENNNIRNNEKNTPAPILAFSTDEGNSWTETADAIKFPEAFINHPQHITISWFQATKKWIMSIAVKDHVECYSSPDLHLWNFESSLGSDFFPEDIKWKRTALFPATDGSHWILLADIKNSGNAATAGGTVYFIGNFDGHNFVNQSSQLHWLDYGRDIYGSLIAIDDNGRTINIGWWNENDSSKTNNDVAGIITLPRELHIENVNTEWVITTAPARELQKIYGKEVKLPPLKVLHKVKDVPLMPDIKIPVEMILKFNTGNIQKGSFPIRFGVNFRNSKAQQLTVGYDRFGFYYIDQSGMASSTQKINGPVKMPYDHIDSTMTFRFIVDGSTLECFTEEGKLVLTSTFSPGEAFNSINLFAINGNIDLIDGKIIELRREPKSN